MLDAVRSTLRRTFLVGQANLNVHLEAPRPQQCWVDQLLPVRHGKHNEVVDLLQAIHLLGATTHTHTHTHTCERRQSVQGDKTESTRVIGAKKSKL